MRKDHFYLNYPDAKNIIVCGDIHGEFNTLVNKLCVQYRMTDTVLIVAGDCGFGFHKPGYYADMLRKNSGRLSKSNNWIVFVRGNHDNPAYFDGKTYAYKRMIAIPDYTVIQACGKSILCVGGGISIDRHFRILKIHNNPNLACNIYWDNEPPVFDDVMLETVGKKYSVDTVISHTAPSFCELKSKGMLEKFAEYDPTLLEDVQKERSTMDKIFNRLINDGHPLDNWLYGHFHQSKNEVIDGVHFRMLDIMELFQIV